MTTSHKARSERLYRDVFGAGRLETADEILDPGIISHAATMPPRPGTDGIKLQAMVLRTAIPDLAVFLEDQIEAGDRVVSRWRAAGTNTGPLRMPGVEVPPSGRSIEFVEIRIDRYEGDRVVESWFIPDRYGLWEQLGLIRPPG